MCKKTIKRKSYQSIQLIKNFIKPSSDLGFSLVELLFTIAIVSILLTLAFPVYRYLIAELRLFILSERISAAINYARSEAIRRQDIVTLCKSKDGRTCSGRWNDGWIIFFGKKITNSFDNTSLLRVYPALDRSDSLEWHGSRSYDYLQLSPDGSTYGQNGSFIVCVRILSKKLVWLIKISQTGRLRIDKKITKSINCNY